MVSSEVLTRLSVTPKYCCTLVPYYCMLWSLPKCPAASRFSTLFHNYIFKLCFVSVCRQYTIMYSKTIRLGSPLEISVLIPSIDEPVTLTAALKTYSWRNGETQDVHTETKMYNNLIGRKYTNQAVHWEYKPSCTVNIWTRLCSEFRYQLE